MISEGEREWDDWEEDEEPSQCLFCDKMDLTVADTFRHMKDNHGFDLVREFSVRKCDMYSCIRCVNYIRSSVAGGEKHIKQYELPDSSAWLKDEYFKPVLENDALLMVEYDELLGDFRKMAVDDSEEVVADEVESLRRQLEEAREATREAEEKLNEITEHFVNLQSAARSVLTEGNESDLSVSDSGSDSDDNEETSRSPLSEYFQSYSHFGIHEDMLKDRVRTESYRDFMYQNSSLFEGKVVLDVGCGTSILSMFAAKSGAAEVIGVDMSNIVTHARKIVKANGLDDRITIVKGKIEETDITQYIKRDLKKIDIIISEWMGYFLLFESMLDSVLYARDRWLNPDGGVVHPDMSTIYLCAANMDTREKETIGFWDSVYGFDMSSVKDSVYKEAFVEVIDHECVVSQPFVLRSIDANVATVRDLEFVSEFSLIVKSPSLSSSQASHEQSAASVEINALVGYFDTLFESGCSNPVYFSTGPEVTPTHWKQTVLYLENPLTATVGDIVKGKISFKRLSTNHRGLTFDVEYGLNGGEKMFTQTYILE